MRLAALRIAVCDIDREHDFHAGRLVPRLASDGRTDGCCVFELDGVDLVAEAVSVDAAGRECALMGRVTGISFAVDDITSVQAQLAAAGMHFSGLTERQFRGGTPATLVDPNGNELQLVRHPPPWPAP
jgi:predicted enzyme related to lactoylglutathione lyase